MPVQRLFLDYQALDMPPPNILIPLKAMAFIGISAMSIMNYTHMKQSQSHIHTTRSDVLLSHESSDRTVSPHDFSGKRIPMRKISDGCQWQKYGQKMAKGNPCVRAYYRCTMVVGSGPEMRRRQIDYDHATYERNHNHRLPPAAIAMASTTSAAACMLFSE
eukprot:Gb_07810 [translate_table: standard]